MVVLVYSCRIRNDFHPKKSIIRRIGSLFLVLAACNNVNLNMALFGFKMIPFIREIRNTLEMPQMKLYSYLKNFQVFKILTLSLLPQAQPNFMTCLTPRPWWLSKSYVHPKNSPRRGGDSKDFLSRHHFIKISFRNCY